MKLYAILPFLTALAFGASPPTVQQSINDSLTGHGFAGLTAASGTIVCADGFRGLTTSGCSTTSDSALIKVLIHDTVTAGTGNWSTKKITVSNVATLDTVEIGGGSTSLLPNGIINAADGAFLVKANGTTVGDSALFHSGKFSNGVSAESLNVTQDVQFPFAGEFPVPLGVNDEGHAITYPTIGNAGEPLVEASTLAGASDTIPMTDWVLGLFSGATVSPSFGPTTVTSLHSTGSDTLSGPVGIGGPNGLWAAGDDEGPLDVTEWQNPNEQVLRIIHYADTNLGGAAVLHFDNAGGTPTHPTGLKAGQQILSIGGRGFYKADSNFNASPLAIQGYIDQASAGLQYPAAWLSFETTSAAEGFRQPDLLLNDDASGSVGIGRVFDASTRPDQLIEAEAIAGAYLHMKSTGNGAGALFDRASTSTSSQVYWETDSSADWSMGVNNGGSDLSIYSYGISNIVMNFNNANGNAQIYKGFKVYGPDSSVSVFSALNTSGPSIIASGNIQTLGTIDFENTAGTGTGAGVLTGGPFAGAAVVPIWIPVIYQGLRYAIPLYGPY